MPDGHLQHPFSIGAHAQARQSLHSSIAAMWLLLSVWAQIGTSSAADANAHALAIIVVADNLS